MLLGRLQFHTAVHLLLSVQAFFFFFFSATAVATKISFSDLVKKNNKIKLSSN